MGVGMVSYYDSQPTADAKIKTTTSLGVLFAFAGIFASSLYTVWIASYHRKLQMSSMQLLFNQAPVSAFLLLYVIPFVDSFPVWSNVPVNRWIMIGMVSPSSPSLPTHSTLDTYNHVVGPLCVPDQHFSVLHHCSDRPRFEHCCRSCQDLYHCRPRLGHLWTGHRGQVSPGCRCSNWWHHCVCFIPSKPKAVCCQANLVCQLFHRHAQGEAKGGWKVVVPWGHQS